MDVTLLIIIVIAILIVAYYVKCNPVFITRGGQSASQSGGQLAGKKTNNHGNYPLIRQSLTTDALREMFARFRNAKPEVVAEDTVVPMDPLKMRDDKRMHIVKAFVTGDEFEPLVDYFVEHARIKCNRSGYQSPLDVYRKNRQRVDATKSLDEKRRTLRQLYRKDCDHSPVDLSSWLFDEWRPKRLLSICGGWGGLVVRSCAYGELSALTMVDPNREVVDAWGEMVKFYGIGDCHVRFINSPFQTAELGDPLLPENQYDVMYTSPPYFTSEHYSRDSGQSYIQFRDVDSWMNGFLRPSLEKMWQYISPGGHVLLQLNDPWAPRADITQRAHDIMDKLPGASWVGTWAFKKYASQKSYQPLFVWQKK